MHASQRLPAFFSQLRNASYASVAFLFPLRGFDSLGTVLAISAE